jgi:Tol biopolymer transport system component
MLDMSRMFAQSFADLEPVTAAFAALAMQCLSRKGAAWQVVCTALMLGLAVMGSGSRLWAQSDAGQDVPTIEPRFTRIFGSDSMEVAYATMSPDGRWIVFGAPTKGIDVMNLWILPAAGGEPVRLTQGAHMDDGPVWFPGSDRIAFRSDRPGPWAIMTLPIDNETGRPAGPPRQVTLEGSQAYFDVSPDGQWIAYTPANERGNRVIRIVPSTGGTARTVGEADTPMPRWAHDGQSLYYTILTGRPSEFGLVRVSLDGEMTDTVFTWPGVITFPNTRYVARMVEGDQNGPTFWELATLEGRSLARFSLPKGMFPDRFLKDGLAFLSGMSDEVAPIQILPVDGGPARPLTEGRAVDEPLAWLPDGERLLFRTTLDGEEVLLLAPVGGGPMRQFQLPEDAWWVGVAERGWTPDFTPIFSADGRHMLYATGDPEVGPSALKVLSLEDGRTWELSGAFHLTDVTGRGGTRFREGGEFVYVEKRGDVYELRASPPEGPSRLVWSFGRDAPGQVGVRGDRILFAKWLEEEEVETTLYVARAGHSEARELIRLSGWLGSPIWSPDGRRIAASHYTDDGSGTGVFGSRKMFLEVSPSGELVGGPRHVGDSMVAYWNDVWLPDSRGILTTGTDANVWLMPVDPSQEPVALTRDDPNTAWNFVLSPDGRHIAYSSRMSRGSSLWLVDLSEALQVGGN